MLQMPTIIVWPVCLLAVTQPRKSLRTRMDFELGFCRAEGKVRGQGGVKKTVNLHLLPCLSQELKHTHTYAYTCTHLVDVSISGENLASSSECMEDAKKHHLCILNIHIIHSHRVCYLHRDRWMVARLRLCFFEISSCSFSFCL